MIIIIIIIIIKYHEKSQKTIPTIRMNICHILLLHVLHTQFNYCIHTIKHLQYTTNIGITTSSGKGMSNFLLRRGKFALRHRPPRLDLRVELGILRLHKTVKVDGVIHLLQSVGKNTLAIFQRIQFVLVGLVLLPVKQKHRTYGFQ